MNRAAGVYLVGLSGELERAGVVVVGKERERESRGGSSTTNGTLVGKGGEIGNGKVSNPAVALENAVSFGVASFFARRSAFLSFPPTHSRPEQSSLTLSFLPSLPSLAARTRLPSPLPLPPRSRPPFGSSRSSSHPSSPPPSPLSGTRRLQEEHQHLAARSVPRWRSSRSGLELEGADDAARESWTRRAQRVECEVRGVEEEFEDAFALSCESLNSL